MLYYLKFHVTKAKIAVLFLLVLALPKVYARQVTIQSPNKKIMVSLIGANGGKTGEWYLKASYNGPQGLTDVLPQIDLGLIRNDQDFSRELRFIKAGVPRIVNEHYTALHGKKSDCSNSAYETVVFLESRTGAKINVIIRAYNDGVAFRYEFPENKGTFNLLDELTAYSIPASSKRWMEKWNTANEGFYTEGKDDSVQQEWCYPALFNNTDGDCWFLLHEADVNRNYCGSKLSNKKDKAKYKITFPDARDGNGIGASQPAISLPWKSPWRVVIIGSLGDIVQSTLVDDVSPPSVLTNTSWIKPGVVSWNYWSSNHGTKDYRTVTKFADLAAFMNWDYTLLDWEWDAMGNGGKLEDAAAYIRSLGVKPLIWYNSGGKHTGVQATPRDRLLTHESRIAEFTKLKKLGFAGVKVDFFESEKQDMVRYYLDILEDAASCEMMVYFHGCLVPRGWARTYPNLMTYEAVRGAEWYNNGPDFTPAAPVHNTILPFTRNVVGAMDYTPVTFTNSQYPHITSYGHELALSVLFESGFQHMADRPEGYMDLPDRARSFLKEVPAAWDDTRLLSGYPGKSAIMARRHGDRWYIGGINAVSNNLNTKIDLGFLPSTGKYKLLLIEDGSHDKVFLEKQVLVDSSSTIDVHMLPRGGFVAVLKPQ
ncbi:glycoside hydrolase family 97 catalytic domain-containing protein [Chitinophaga sp.]|uniref:glycoside hydrolase family 97 protein n=1 Tax=Chitinophaga sp. TaxID=1869181 RepID=UPI0031D3922D